MSQDRSGGFLYQEDVMRQVWGRLPGSTAVQVTALWLAVGWVAATSASGEPAAGAGLVPAGTPTAVGADTVPAGPAATVEEELPDDYLPFNFVLSDSGLVGSSKFLQGFTVTMRVDPARFPQGLDLEALFAAVRDDSIRGTLIAPSGRASVIRYELVRHRGPEEIYMKTRQGYFLWEYIKVKEKELSMAIYWWYCPPASPADLAALEKAAQLLADPQHWHQEDDRKCDDDEANDRWSLFCALKVASIQSMGEYNHHNTAMQTVRFVIDDIVPNHGFAHTLMDYNTAATTSHADILHVLDLARQRVAAQLAKTGPAEKRE